MYLRLLRGDTRNSTKVLTLSGSETTTTSTYTNATFDGDIAGCTYRPTFPDHDITRRSFPFSDGAKVTHITRENVVETLDLKVKDDAADMLAVIGEIQKYFLQAERRRETGLGDRIWIEYDPIADDDTGSGLMRSELLAGRIDLEDKSLTRMIKGERLQIGLIWERRPWWEGDEVEARLYQTPDVGVGMAATGGVTIMNHDDGDANDNNYVDLVLPTATKFPAPTRIEIKNSGGRPWDRVFMALNSQASGTGFSHVFEAEDRILSIGDTVSDATASNGQYLNATWSGSVAYQAENIAAWTLTSTFSNSASGNHFRVILFLFEPPGITASYQARLTIQSNTGNDLLSTDWVDLDDGRHIHEITTLQWPPKLRGEYDMSAVRLIMTARSASTGSLGVKTDYMQFTPLDGWRRTDTVGTFTLSPGQSLVDDGIEELTPYALITGKKFPEWVGYGNQIELDHDPSASQRMYFLLEADAGQTTSATMSGIVRVYYRPRKLYPY